MHSPFPRATFVALVQEAATYLSSQTLSKRQLL